MLYAQPDDKSINVSLLEIGAKENIKKQISSLENQLSKTLSDVKFVKSEKMEINNLQFTFLKGHGSKEGFFGVDKVAISFALFSTNNENYFVLLSLVAVEASENYRSDLKAIVNSIRLKN